jgi:hypothetical protein
MKDAKNKVLHDPIAYDIRVSDIQFPGPRKEQTTTGRFMSAGSYYGMGHRTPIGSTQARSIENGPIPFGCAAFNPAEAIR